MSNMNKDLLALIERIVNKMTVWNRIYKGQVVDLNDPLKKGRVRVTIYDLGFITADKGFWCSPTEGNSISMPAQGDWVNVYFEAGDRSRPKYFGKSQDMSGQLPNSYDGKPSTHILFEEPSGKQKVIYDANGNTLKVGAGTQAVVLGNAFMTLFNSHVHATAGVGPPVPPTVPMGAAQLSTKVKVE